MPDTVFSFSSNIILYVTIFVLGVVADLSSKSYVFKNFFDPFAEYQPVHWWVDGVLGIQTSTNAGALFGIGAGYHWIFAAISVVFLAFILSWLFLAKGIRDRWLAVCLAMISGGIVGNFYDRIGLGFGFGLPEGCRNHVRDFIYFRIEGVSIFDPWPNFNIADSLLVVGACLLFVHGIWRGK